MGLIISRWRKKPSTLEKLKKIHAEILSLDSDKRDTLAWQKKVIGYLLAYFSVLYLAAAVVVYFRFFYHPEWQSLGSQLMLWVPFLVAPIILWIVRKVLTWWYHRKVSRNERQLSKLVETKTEILNDVMETETYKVAKEILEKYAPEKLSTTKPTIATKPGLDPKAGKPLENKRGVGDSGQRQEGTELRRRTVNAGETKPNLSSTLPLTTSFNNKKISELPVTRGRGRGWEAASPGERPGPSAGSRFLNDSMRTGGNRALNRSQAMGLPEFSPQPGVRPPGPPLPRPILQRERGYMDRMVEYLVGDGPSNRYALICKQCQSHNGMALKEEFEYIAYRCCYCFCWNPARKQRPVAPRLSSTLMKEISSSDSSSSSEEDGQTKRVLPELNVEKHSSSPESEKQTKQEEPAKLPASAKDDISENEDKNQVKTEEPEENVEHPSGELKSEDSEDEQKTDNMNDN